MRYMRMAIGLCLVVCSGCTTTFEGYRKSPQSPAEILRGEHLEESDPEIFQLKKAPVEGGQSHVDTPGSSLSVPLQTAVPLMPTEYRRVWVAPHKNRFGDAVHGHYCEILFRPAEFKEQPIPKMPPSAPVLLKKSARDTPPRATMPASASMPSNTPTNLQDYLQRMGIHHGQ